VSRILLVYNNPLFAHSIRAVLTAAPRHTLIGEFDDWARAEAEMLRLAPDIVIVEEGEGQATDEMLHTLRTQPTPWQVIAMRLDETTMHVWSGAWEPITRTQDLLDALEARPVRSAARRPPLARRKRMFKGTSERTD
jgi:AmiR/NasT family two-component response regulator